MPNMRKPVQQRRPVEQQPAEYATKADVEVLAAEVRGLRESVDARFEKVEAEIRGLRESTEAEIRGFREAADARLSAHDQMLDRIDRHLERIDQRFDEQDARHRASVRWIIGAVLAMGGLILAALRFGQTGIG